MTIKISLTQIKKAIAKAEKTFSKSEDWSAQIVEIAMLPKIHKALEKINNTNINLTRVQTKFGPGYLLERWNSIREDYYSTHPSTVFNGLRREYIGIMDLEYLRMTALGHDATSQLRHFTISLN
jgi:hypothetical protein